MKRQIVVFALLIISVYSYSQNRRFAELRNDTVYRIIVVQSDSLAHALFGGTWVETYKDSTGKNYAGIGYKYHPDKKNFSSPKPFPSWTLDENLIWQPPTPMPTDGKMYYWKEETQEWLEIQ